MRDPRAWSAPAAVRPEPRPLDRAELLGGLIPLRPLGVSETLDGAITGIRGNPRAVLGLSVTLVTVVQVFVSLIQYAFFGDAVKGATVAAVVRAVGGQWPLTLLSLVLTAYATLLLAGLLAPMYGRTLFGQRASLGRVWADARAQYPGEHPLARLFGAATGLMVLWLAAAFLPIVPFILLAAGGGPVPLAVFSALVGFPAGLVLMVWVYVRYVLAVPAVALERVPVTVGFRRAARLLRGGWWRTCGVLLLTLLITMFMQTVLRVPAIFIEGLVNWLSDGNAGREVLLTIDTLGRILSSTLTTPFDAGVIALIYIDLRMRREGLDLDVQTRDDAGVSGRFLDLWRAS